MDPCQDCCANAQECDYYDGDCSGPYEKTVPVMACIVPALFVLLVGLCVILGIWCYVIARL